MNNRTQTRVIDELIAFDEGSLAALNLKIHAAQQERHGSPTLRQSQEVAAWRLSRLTLRQGLEGLRLKHDSLADAGGMH